MLEMWKESYSMLLADCEKRFFIAIRQLKIGPEFLPTVRAGHEHTSDIKGKAQFLATFAALLGGVFVHRSRKLVGYKKYTVKAEEGHT